MTNEFDAGRAIEILEDDELEQENAAMGEQSKMDRQYQDGSWHFVKYEGLFGVCEAPAMYKAKCDAWYSFEFAGIPTRQLEVIGPCVPASLPVGVPDEPLPHWEPCNPGCDPEFNGSRSRHCAELCHNAREALAAPTVKAEQVQLADSRRNRVYLAGPMTGYAEFNFPAFNAEADRLRATGLEVVNPAEHGIVDGAEWCDYLRYDIAQLSRCEAIHFLPGWQESKGARLEHSIAVSLGMRMSFADGAAPSLPAAGSAEWIEHGPSKACPFSSPYTSKVDVRLRDGSERLGDLACNAMWFWYEHDPKPYDVVAYRAAALSAQQSAFGLQAAVDQLAEIERSSAARRKRIDESLDQQSVQEVSVSRELVERLVVAERDCLHGQFEAAMDELRALLASHGRGEA